MFHINDESKQPQPKAKLFMFVQSCFFKMFQIPFIKVQGSERIVHIKQPNITAKQNVAFPFQFPSFMVLTFACLLN